MIAQQLSYGWKHVKFGDIAEQISIRVNPEVGDEKSYIGLEHLDSGSLKVKCWGSDVVLKGQKLAMHKGDILFAKRNAYLKRVAIAPFQGIFSAHGMVIRPLEGVVIPDFLPYLMQSDVFMNRAIAISEGSLSPTIKWKTLREQVFSIPSLAEQKKKVNVLKRIDTAIYSHEEIVVSSEKLIQTLLIDSLYKSELPIRTFGSLCSIIDPNPSHRYPKSTERGVPLLSTENFDGEDSYSFDKASFVSDDVYKEQLGRCNYTKDDIVFARKGRIGFARFYGEEVKCFSHTIALIKANKEIVSPDFILYLLRSIKTLANIRNMMNSNSGVPTLGLKTLSDLKVPFPTLEQQEKIVSSLKHLQLAAASSTKSIQELKAVKSVILNQ